MTDQQQPQRPSESEDVDRNFAAAMPHSIYFYYFEFANGSRLRSRIYYHLDVASPIADPVPIIEQMARNAYGDGAQWLSLGDSIQDLIRRRVGYVAIMAKSDVAPVPVPFTFNEVGGGVATHTFSRITPLSLQVSPTDTLRGGYCLNILWNRTAGRPLDYGEYERFDLSFPLSGGPGAAFPDSGGTNMGPPVPPP